MSRRPLTGRADLLLALAGNEAVVADVAQRLGFERVQPLFEPVLLAGVPAELEPELLESQVELAARPPVPFWRAESFSLRQITSPPPPPPGPDDDDSEFEVTLARFDPLATAAEILTRLRHVADLTRPGTRIDVDRVVFEISRARQLTEIPRLNRRSWGQDLHVVIDLARRLVPYRRDQKMLGRAMKRLLPKGGGTISVLREGSDTPIIEWPAGAAGEELRPRAGATVLVLSDLGTLQDPNPRAAENRWMRIGRQLVERECAALALVPCRPDAVPSGLARLWTLIPWERRSGRRPTPSADVTNAARQRMLTLLSPAARIEPRLLRAVRKLVPEGRRDPGLEAKVWQLCQGTTHCSAAALTRQQVDTFRDALVDDPLKQQAWALIEAAHRDEYPGVACLEVVNLGNQAARFGAGKHVQRSRQWIRGIGEGEAEFGDDFFRKAAEQLTSEAWETFPQLHALWNRYCQDDAAPADYDPALAGVDAPLQTVQISLVGDQIEYRRQGAATPRSTPLATVRLKNPQIVVDEFDDWPHDDDPDELWPTGEAPAWAQRWGRDEIGPWVELAIDGVRQRMRWIPAGKFLMGSPEKPAAEGYPEMPPQPVTISRGFWVFDTPCTQALWEAEMGENPSHFKGDHRPVEQVSWDNCQQFLSRINERFPGLELNLPTEAQWEYACRAGADAPTYADDGRLERIAWYGDNAGDETHDVAELQPNNWGLHDTLGNVWEWCRDLGHRPYSNEPVTDPLHEQGSTSTFRVVRGGCWANSARLVRGAYRGGYPPGNRYRDHGFRCFGSGSEPTGPGRRPVVVRSQRAVRESEREAEPRDDREPASAERGVRITDRAAEFAPVPQGPIVRIRTDLEDAFLCRTLRPDWATRAGRDQFGLWAEFTVASTEASSRTVTRGQATRNTDDVTQRLRWIPPGRFLLGSPESELGRHSDEGPQHEATISEGFWLFDTPCTQALWEAVMEENPSDFKGQQRPVENVSWDDCRDFLYKLNDAVPGLAVQLPLESQWEYACRAGTETATFAGTFDPEDEATQEDLKRIAWYKRNTEKETHAVAELQPNSWGLYDMLGNVWEWCGDTWRDNYDVPHPSDEPSARRIVRGGGWAHSARLVRAAYRDGGHPGDRSHDLGFRCSVQCSHLAPPR